MYTIYIYKLFEAYIPLYIVHISLSFYTYPSICNIYRFKIVGILYRCDNPNKIHPYIKRTLEQRMLHPKFASPCPDQG